MTMMRLTKSGMRQVDMADLTSVMARYENVVPVPVFDIIRQMGIDLQFSVLDGEISGWIEKKDDGNYQIVINDDHALTRKRFTAAHELAHYLYHRNILGDGTGDTRAYRTEKTPFANAAVRPRLNGKRIPSPLTYLCRSS